MAQHFLYVIPVDQGNFLVKRSLSGFSKHSGIKDWVAVGPFPLPPPPDGPASQQEVTQYLEDLKTKSPSLKQLGPPVT
jgi:hypothetical protein